MWYVYVRILVKKRMHEYSLYLHCTYAYFLWFAHQFSWDKWFDFMRGWLKFLFPALFQWRIFWKFYWLRKEAIRTHAYERKYFNIAILSELHFFPIQGSVQRRQRFQTECGEGKHRGSETRDGGEYRCAQMNGSMMLCESLLAVACCYVICFINSIKLYD